MPGNKRPNRKPGSKSAAKRAAARKAKQNQSADDGASPNMRGDKASTPAYGTPKGARSTISPSMNRGSARGG